MELKLDITSISHAGEIDVNIDVGQDTVAPIDNYVIGDYVIGGYVIGNYVIGVLFIDYGSTYACVSVILRINHGIYYLLCLVVYIYIYI